MSLMYADMALSVGKAGFSFASARSNSKFQKAMQGYQNAMLSVQAAQANNITTINEIQAQEQSQRASQQLQEQAMLAQGSADVAAGAAGVGGNSTSAVSMNLSRSLARANFARTEQLRKQYIAYGQERRNIALERATGKDVSVIPAPSGAAAILGIGSTLLKTYDSYQPEGSKLGDFMVKKKTRLYK